MKKSSKSILYLTIIILIITVAILIGIIMNILKSNKILSNNEINKEQLGETTINNSYIEAQLHFKELKDEEEKLLSFKSSIATAITNEGITTSSSDTASIMAYNISNILKTKTTLNSDVAATADNISQGKQAWVNGEKIIGTGANTNSTINTNGNELLLNASNGTNNGTTTTNFTCTSSGVLFVWANRGYTPRSLVIKINDVEVVNYAVVSNTDPLRQIINIKEGDSIEITNKHYTGDEFVGVYYFE